MKSEKRPTANSLPDFLNFNKCPSDEGQLESVRYSLNRLRYATSEKFRGLDGTFRELRASKAVG